MYFQIPAPNRVHSSAQAGCAAVPQVPRPEPARRPARLPASDAAAAAAAGGVRPPGGVVGDVRGPRGPPRPRAPQQRPPPDLRLRLRRGAPLARPVPRRQQAEQRHQHRPGRPPRARGP